MAKYQNPVIRGFNPDPSVCRVGKDFYLVTSTFEFFPGVPIYHSENLVDWTLINCCLKTKKQLPLGDAWHSGGIYAPTIRYRNGTFYMTVTNVSAGGNFIVKTTDIYGDWSDPIYVDQSGIDPSLFFDDDGKVYYLSTFYDETLPETERAAIQISQIDVDTGKILRGPEILHSGSGGRNVEAPHLYKKEDKYYLMLAEGGTEYGHMETIFRADSVYGRYEGCPRNPILTHRNRPYSPIQCTGHADLTGDENGNWWMVFLGVRQIPFATMHHLGRETFLAPVVWGEDGFPVVGDGGTVSPCCDAPLPGGTVCGPKKSVRYYLTENLPEFTYVRNPKEENYVFSPRGLTMTGEGAKLSDDKVSPTFLGIRQREFGTVFTACVSEFDGVGGITVYNNRNYHYDVVLEKKNGKATVALRRAVHDLRVSDTPVPVENKELLLRIRGGETFYSFEVEQNGKIIPLGQAAVAGLCSEGMMYMNFTGAFVGLFAENGKFRFSCIDIKD